MKKTEFFIDCKTKHCDNCQFLASIETYNGLYNGLCLLFNKMLKVDNFDIYSTIKEKAAQQGNVENGANK